MTKVRHAARQRRQDAPGIIFLSMKVYFGSQFGRCGPSWQEARWRACRVVTVIEPAHVQTEEAVRDILCSPGLLPPCYSVGFTLRVDGSLLVKTL